MKTMYKHHCGQIFKMDELTRSTCAGCGRDIGRLDRVDIISALIKEVKRLKSSIEELESEMYDSAEEHKAEEERERMWDDE